MRVSARTDRCVSSGQCVLTAPEVFDQDDDQGLVVVLDPEPAPGLHERVREAEAMCPVQAVLVRED
ncbi:ferredoxin [Allokutzneria oryzae]|uniref:Ferredoxin n=1 Tax=Allokutzneria oryzae TaxID=1378989 RepID=A0ABV5ZUS5_9PSEU